MTEFVFMVVVGIWSDRSCVDSETFYSGIITHGITRITDVPEVRALGS